MAVTTSTKKQPYIAKPVDHLGNAVYTAEENATWQQLVKRQWDIVKNRAAKEYLDGLSLLNLPKDRIPQCPEVSAVLQKATQFALEPVPALIPDEQFFALIANRLFPAATFIRRIGELDYLEEPDIFHEVFGHCPLLTNRAYADFTALYGKLALQASLAERIFLGRLYWFTIEFGLIQTKQGLRAYGGGIISSMQETVYCLESKVPKRLPFDILTVLRTPYRIDRLQPIYYVIDSLEQLYELMEIDLMYYIHQAEALGDLQNVLPLNE